MKCPKKCPACGGNFMFEFSGINDKYLYATCALHTSHKISFMMLVGDDEIIHMCITINMEKQVKVVFHFKTNLIEFGKGPSNKFISNATGSLPWFDPDLSDYAKLVDKLKTYVIMS
jgi:hypothetical protein